MASVSRSKTAVPVLPPEFVHRPELLEVLDGGADRGLTLVCAPPGYGKTLLLADWARRHDGPCAWVTLDEEDDDPRRLWASVLAALTLCPAVPASSRLRSLVVPRTTVGVDFLTDLLEALAAVPVRVRLVLDDAHHLTSKEALHGLHPLLRHRQSNVRLVLSSRSDPALPVARLRLEDGSARSGRRSWGSLPRDGDTGRTLRPTPDAGQTAAAPCRTDGWVAGIRLAAMPLRGHAYPDRFLADFSGDERPVADYLAGEVLLAHLGRGGGRAPPVQHHRPRPGGLATELSGRPTPPTCSCPGTPHGARHGVRRAPTPSSASRN